MAWWIVADQLGDEGASVLSDTEFQCDGELSWLVVDGETKSPEDVITEVIQAAFFEKYGPTFLEIQESVRAAINKIDLLSQTVEVPSAVTGFSEYAKSIFPSDITSTSDTEPNVGFKNGDFLTNVTDAAGDPDGLRTWAFAAAGSITDYLRENAGDPSEAKLIEIRTALGQINGYLSTMQVPWPQFQSAVKCKFDQRVRAAEAIQKLSGQPGQDLTATADIQQVGADIEALAREGLQNLQDNQTAITDLLPDLIQDIDLKEQCFMLVNLFNLATIKERIDHGTSTIFGPTTTTAPRVNGGLPPAYSYSSDAPTPQEAQMAAANAVQQQAIQQAVADAAVAASNAANIKEANLSMKQLPQAAGDASSNRSVMVVGDTFGFMNNLTQSPSKAAFYNMTNAQISTLQPMIRLFKVYRVEGATDPLCPLEKEVEFQFDANAPANIQEILQQNKGIRNPGVGLKSFNFAYEANNPFAVKKSISAKLTIHANSFSELLEKRTNLNGDSYSYVDLALKTGNFETFKLNRQLSEVQLDNLEKLNFRLKVVVGWQNPLFTSDIFSATPGITDAINNSAITLNLTPTVHDFSIDDIGRVTFTINYLAYVEDYFDNSYFDIFTEKDVIVSRLKRNLKIKKQNRDCSTDQSELDKKDDKLAEEIRIEKQKALRHLFTSLITKKKVYFISIRPSDLYFYTGGGPYGLASELYGTAEDLEKKIKSGFDSNDDQRAARTAATTAVVPEDSEEEIEQDVTLSKNSTITFFYAGDLVDSILEDIGTSLIEVGNEISAMQDPQAAGVDQIDLTTEVERYSRMAENFKKLRILLGPVEIVDSDSYNSKIINLGDIPISLKHFMEWLTTKLLDKEQATYSLTKFLNDFFNTYILDYMNNDTCYGSKAKQKISLFESALTEYRASDEDEDSITKKCIESGTKRLSIPQDFPSLPLLNIMGVRDDPRSNGGICKEINYLAFYAGRQIPLQTMSGVKEEDEAKGVWHYQIGKDRGIVKTINLSKTDSTGLAEVRFEQDGYDGLRQLRVLYDTTIKTYLDIGAFPGCYIYVEPKGFDPSGRFDKISLDELGIGGYCMLWKTEHVIQPGLAESTLYAKWVASKDGPVEAEGEAEDTTQEKCSSTTRG